MIGRKSLIQIALIALLTSANYPPTTDTGFEIDEVAILASVAGHARGMAGGLPICVNLHLQRQLPNAPIAAREWARSAREGGAMGFVRVQRAMERSLGQTGTTDRDLDGRVLIEAGLANGSLVDRCPVAQRLALSRAIRSGSAAIIDGSIEVACQSGIIMIALRRRGRSWQVEGSHIVWIPDSDLGCDSETSRQLAGHFLLLSS